MAVDKRKFVQIQIEALSIHYYTTLYNQLEAELKAYFVENISLITPEKRELLYFALAGIKSNQISFEVDNATITLSKVKYISDENFSAFTVNQIIKFQKKYDLISGLNFNVQSFNSKSMVYPFADCFLKLINMRNKLAHEMSHLSFTDSDIIEILSNDCIREKGTAWFDTLDTTLMSDESKSIFSNMLIMDNMLSELRKRAGKQNEKVDS